MNPCKLRITPHTLELQPGGKIIADGTTILVLAILFFATFIRSAFGFGEALVAVPLLALIMPVNVAAPVAVLVSITVAAVIIAQDWRNIHFRSAWWLVVSTLFGTPLGLLLLTAAAERVVKGLLAAVIILFSAYSLIQRKRIELKNDRYAWIFGFIAGILGGAYGMNGPPLVIYGTLRGWTPQQFRATLQGYFLPASLMVIGGYWLTGLWVWPVSRYYLLALPAVIVAIFLGRVANRRMGRRAFIRLVHAGLIVIGLTLLVQSFS